MYRKIYQSCLTCDKRKKHEIETEPEIEEPPQPQAQEAEPEKQKETPVPPTDKIKPLTHAYAIEEDKDFEESVKNEVQRLWRDVEKQCQDSNSELQPLTEDTKTDIDWNIIRVFVSSTFTDFFNEREVLVKKVFPELREWCQGRGLKLVECDLRWGIPKDTSTAETILVCLDELERCRKTNKNLPFFINLVGERYGWIPSVKETPEEAKEKYQWVEGASITFMEVLYGAYREANPNAAFFMRNSSVCNDIPQAHISRFIDAEPVAKCHLKMLRSKLCSRFPNQVFPYNCSFKQINNTTGREQVELSGLDTFADLVLNFLKNAIEKTYPVSNIAETEVDANKQEQDLQWMFILDKSKDFIGRQTDLQNLQEYIESGQSTHLEKTVLDEDHNPDSNVRWQADWEVEDTDVSLLVLEGPSGWGKTTLLCKLILDTVKTGSNIFYHIVGSTPTSIQVDCLLKRLLQTLLPEPTDDQKIVLNSDSIEDLQSLLKEALVSYRKKKDQKLIVIIDGASELDTSDIYKHLFWLPPSFPNNIRCIVSTDLHPPTTARLYEYPTYKMTLQSMSPEDLSTLAVRYLAQFNKRLDPTQLNKIIMNTKADNPLWVMLMTEELRVFGDFRLMDSKIDNFPDNMSDFLSQVIDRLTHEDDENEIIKKVLCLTACSKHGLPLDHILKILGNIQSKEELAPMYWAKARRALKPYLRVSGHSENLLAFAHQPVLTAVRNHLLADRMEAAQWHTTLADFYQFWCEDARTKCYHLPYHLESAMLQARLLDFLQQDPDSYFYIFPFQRSSFLKNVRCNMIASENIPSTAPIMLCHMCATATRGWNPACNWSNKSCCVVCGGLTNMGPGATPARACSRHADGKGPGKVKCVLCNFIVDINLKTGPLVPTPGQICNTCNNFGHNLCARFNV
ncbi:TPR repeat-containing protein DDB_G0287407-like [Biomphalaria glabrata]|uniref:TPR repeat-containing protein DDB_G0287407-like n=1 Tax=Biomphalaria glabrata TaxID=6526 RepID=A0A9U8E1V5_BIOGL|nr:TPR repeat-containing protein DDB_G0287407-like [Biomphalaria glabrata]